MRLTFPYQTERLGAVRIYGLQHIFELDSGPQETGEGDNWGTTVAHVPASAIEDVERRMAIVVPCKDERLRVFEGVLAGIPHSCLVIVVSNSAREPVDRFMMERDSLLRFCRFNQRTALMVHQRDPGLGAAFAKAGIPEIAADNDLVPNGKGEGMVVGIALAMLAGKEYVGFIDADNYVPGAVNEYVRAYAADFSLARTRFPMVRISWHSKPKVIEGTLFFKRFGRTSEVTNRFLNALVSHHTGFGTEAIRTGNAGEHALSLDLAVRLRFASGFSVEPFEIVELFQRFGGYSDVEHPEVMREGVEIYQVETCNPHFHEDKGSEHVDEMRFAALEAIYHSGACPARLKEEIVEYLNKERGGETEPRPPTTYPALSRLDQVAFLDVLTREADTFEQVLRPAPSPLVMDPPIPEPGSNHA